MAGSRWTWAQRRELHHILDWTRQPVSTQAQYNVRFAVMCLLNGQDAQKEMIEKLGLEPFVAKRFFYKATVILGNERAKRRNAKATERILAERGVKRPAEFTTENFRFTMDHSEHKDYNMANVSIYCIVEVWEEGENHAAEKEYLVNFSDIRVKEWLTRLMVWGLMNKRELVIKPATEDELTSMKMFVPRDKDVT